MKKITLLTMILFFLFSQIGKSQFARVYNYEDVIKIKKGTVYFVIPEGMEELRSMYENTINKYWDFSKIEIKSLRSIKRLKDQEGKYMMSATSSSVTMGKRDQIDVWRHGGTVSRGSTSSFSLLFMSRKIHPVVFRSPIRWGAAVTSTNEQDIVDFFPLYLRVMNSMLHKIEDTQAKRFGAKPASAIYNSDNDKIDKRMILILDEQIPSTKYNINYVKKLYKEEIKIVSRDELIEAIQSEKDVIFLNFYKELQFHMYTAMSCKTGDVISLGRKRTLYTKQFFEWALKDLNEN